MLLWEKKEIMAIIGKKEIMAITGKKEIMANQISICHIESWHSIFERVYAFSLDYFIGFFEDYIK